MDGIATIGRSLTARAARPTASGGTFRLDPPRAESVGATAPTHAIAAPATIPDDPAARDRRAAARAQRLLSDLTALQTGLLTGAADPAALRRLADSAATEPPADPILAEALAAISLRAQVELARRGNTVAPR